MPLRGYFSVLGHLNSVFALCCFLKSMICNSHYLMELESVSKQELAKLNSELLQNDPHISNIFGPNNTFTSMTVSDLYGFD
jgi:hypothetical protein